MDKIRNYNQILLSITGTIVMLFLLVSGLLFLWLISKEIFSGDNLDNTGILAVEETDR